MRASHEPAEVITASPSKRIYQSIIADYDLNRSICELIDNALDAWKQNRQNVSLCIQLTLNTDQQSIRIEDDAGGVPYANLKSLVSPGDSRNQAEDITIGYFGVGSKRAAVALAMDISITTREVGEGGFRVRYDEEWLVTEDDWNIAIYRVDGAPEGSTIIELNRLRISINHNDIERLQAHLAQTYGWFLKDNRLSLLINGHRIEPVDYECWAYPPGFEPRRLTMTLSDENGNIEVTILGGLMTKASPGEGEYGVYAYANSRLIARALKTPDVGFVTGQAGKPHPLASLMRVIVSFAGPARSMPWNSSKSDINTQHWVFRGMRPTLIDFTAHWAKLSRRWSGQWTTMVGPYKTGQIKDELILDPAKPSRSYLPKLPSTRSPSFTDVVTKSNQALRKEKPWVSGIIDGLIAVDLILKQHKLQQRNRIALMLLDSTLEIAIKDYLVNESRCQYGDAELATIFKSRHKVQQEFVKYVLTIPQWEWDKIDHFYKIRCKLVHERVSAGISDEQIESHREVVFKVLKEAFKLKL